jgi:hypothetical protein
LTPFFYLVKVPTYRLYLQWDSNPGVILTEVFVIFLSLSKDRTLRQAVSCPLLYPYLRAIHDNFSVSTQTINFNVWYEVGEVMRIVSQT